MTYTTKTLRNEYMKKAQDIGSNAIKLVNDFFSRGIQDNIEKSTGCFICVGTYDWTLTDLDRALDEMGKSEPQITVVSNATHGDVQYKPLKYEKIGFDAMEELK